MSASTMKQQAAKVRAQILKKVGKRPKSSAVIAEQVGLSEGATRRHLMAATKSGAVVQEKEGKAYVFRLPTAGKSMAEALVP